MKKKVGKCLLIFFFIVVVIVAILNTYKWVVYGEQYIKISTSNKALTNSDLFLSVIAQEKGVDLETKTKIKLLNSNGKKVKDATVSYDGNNATIGIPEIETGTYFIEAKVSSKAGKDTVKKEIYISNGNTENVTITLDKGIYKPNDTVDFRALLTNQENDEPIVKESNISIYDGNDNKVYNENVKTSDYGILSGNFHLADEVNSGLYKLVIKTNTTETTKQFKVNPYVMPKYEVKVNYDKENYLVGDIAKININAKYFFGEAVQNSKCVVYINGENYKTVTTDGDGNATIEYEIKEARTYTLKVETVDSSNYFVETNSSFVAGTDIFEIELLSEYGSLIAGIKNEVYVFTKNANGTPIKTYVTISSDNYTKQIATDENGIGKFAIDIDALENNNNNYYNNYSKSERNKTKSFQIIAQDMNANKVNKNVSLSIENKNLLLSTDMPKYNQGEDIKINVFSADENTKNIYFFKNDKLIKMISTDLAETTVNLDDNYGLIDIYITGESNSSYYVSSHNSNSYKRTVFIKPTKQLNIAINTDKQEYNPGDNINISFGTTDENSANVEASLLVSMLDNSILSLANNDLSIDNIKLALSNINFSDELDAATLYSCIVNDNSEQTIMALLLKQGSKDVNVSETVTNDYEQKEKSAVISVISIIIIVISVVVYLCVRFPKLRNVMKHIANCIIFELVVVILSFCIIDEFLWRISDYFWWIFAFETIACLVIYITWISKISSKLFRTSISIIVSCIIGMTFVLLAQELEVQVIWIILILLLLLLIFAIVAKINELKKLKLNKFIKNITKEIIYICKFLGALIISLIIAGIIQGIIDIYEIFIPISIVLLYLLNYKFNKLRKEEKEEEKNKTISFYIVIALAIIGVMAIGYFVINNFSDMGNVAQSAPQYGTEGFEIINPSIDEEVGSIKSDGVSSILNDASDLFNINKGTKNETTTQSESNVKPTESVTDSKIRNVFLESMCFVPELITTNGKADLNLKLSDNITTWTIQTIGNTKDGKIGYGILDTVKVFKEFFVDFELPKNLIETDKVSIPVTVNNYTDNTINTTLNIKEDEWFTLNRQNNIVLNIKAQSSSMMYIPITILKSGNNIFRVEATSNSLTDIVEKEFKVNPKGYKVEKVVSTGNLDGDISEDILMLEDVIEGTSSAKVKIYATTMAQTVEGMDNIFRMPTGCFEQVSSSLYPNILALKYLEDNGIVNEELKTKAISYISSGYQKLLAYEVKGESGGYSLYGRSPAETVLTAYGLMELTDLKQVYNVDENVIKKMNDFIYKKQNSNGAFTITGSHIGGANNREKISLDAYITWALSESNPKDERLAKSIEYLKNKIDDVDDNYTLALIANSLANIGDKKANDIAKRLVNNISLDGNNAYITSNIRDYYGSMSNSQTVQTVALTSMALSKTSYNVNTNKMLINYLISKKDISGTWYTTQATILSLKALNELNENNKLENQTITVKVNSDEQKIEIKDNPIELYQLTFNNLNKENKLNIHIEKGSAYYEVIEEYYIPFEKVDTSKDSIEVLVEANQKLKVNEVLNANIKLINKASSDIYNGMVTIAIPQGFTAIEDSLMLLETKGIIEKYETTYTSINLYLKDFDINQIVDLNVKFRASYPVQITGLSIRAYDYYNPEIEGRAMPLAIQVSD